MPGQATASLMALFLGASCNGVHLAVAVRIVWGGRLCKRCCKIFSGSSPFLPVELSENMLQNLFLNLPPQTVAPKKTISCSANSTP